MKSHRQRIPRSVASSSNIDTIGGRYLRKVAMATAIATTMAKPLFNESLFPVETAPVWSGLRYRHHGKEFKVSSQEEYDRMLIAYGRDSMY